MFRRRCRRRRAPRLRQSQPHFRYARTGLRHDPPGGERPMNPRTSLALLTVLLPAALAAQPRTTLDIYVIDVEGGNATLFVAPSGESLLIDTGNGGQAAARDAGRIMAAVQDAALMRIDHLITTH